LNRKLVPLGLAAEIGFGGEDGGGEDDYGDEGREKMDGLVAKLSN